MNGVEGREAAPRVLPFHYSPRRPEIASPHGALRTLENVVRADAQPDDVGVSGARRGAIAKERTAIGRPGHFKHTWLALIAFDAQAWMETPPRAEIINHLLYR